MRKRRQSLGWLLLFLGMPIAGVPVQHAGSLTAFVGSAFKPASEEIGELFNHRTGIDFTAHYGGSGDMLSQMLLAKRGDIYIAGSPDFMQKAKDAGAVIEDSVQILAYLIPAIQVQRGNPKGIAGLDDLAREDVRVVIANPRTVCIGLYAVEIFEASGLSRRMRPKIQSYTGSCARTANIIAMGGVDAVVGWRIYSFWNPARIETILLKPEQIPRIGYIAIAISTFTQDRALAGRLLEFMVSPEAKEILGRYGYLLEEQTARSYAPRARIGGVYKPPEGW